MPVLSMVIGLIVTQVYIYKYYIMNIFKMLRSSKKCRVLVLAQILSTYNFNPSRNGSSLQVKFWNMGNQ